MKLLRAASVLALMIAILAGCDRASQPESTGAAPPRAEKREFVVSAPAGDRVDPYYWIRDDAREDPDVIALLEAENAWTEAALAGQQAQIADLAAEMRARIPDEQISAPYFENGYWYYTRFAAGGEYPIQARREGSMQAAEEILLDGNRLAEGRDFFQIGRTDVSPDSRRLVWLQDEVGRRQYRMFIKELDSGTVTDTGISGVSSVSWSADGQSVFYVENDPETLRSFRVRRYFPAEPARNGILYEEPDTAYYTSVGRTRSGRYNYVEEFDPFVDFLAVAERADGLRRLRVLEHGTGDARLIEFDEPVYTAQLGRNPGDDTHRLQFVYTSLTTPRQTFEYDMSTGQRRMIDQLEVSGGFDADDYITWRVWAEARDGTRVPVSLLRHRNTPLDGSAPLYQYGYGSYGSSIDPAFSGNRLSLVDRGFVYAIAHVRGGQELGRDWYEQGRLTNKINTFTDFIDVTDWLAGQGMIDGDRVFAAGGSAGGLLMGAVANMAPEKYAGIVAHVPFVDVVTTMLDETIPLTTNEFDEWGNPKQPDFYEYMLSYSPYDNVQRGEYPAMLVTTGLWDSQVQYWEPVKWVARLREYRTDDRPLLLKVNMEAGHGGQSGRFRRLEQTALEYGFILDQAGLGR